MKTVKSKSILIVEDEVSLRKILASSIKKEGFKVIEAGDGAEGLSKALKNHPDLILLDIVMPVMDGFAMIERLRKDKWGKDAPVIVLTNLNDVEKAADFLKSGVYNYLIKTDWKIADIISRIKKTLK